MDELIATGAQPDLACFDAALAACVSSVAKASPAASSSAAAVGGALGAPEQEQEASLACEALHASEGFCDIVHVSADGRSMLSAGWDGKLASVNAAAKPPSRAWMVGIAGKGGMLTAAAVSADVGYLALAQEYSNGFGVWVCPLDQKLGPSMDKLKLVARFTLPVRHLSWHPSRALLGMATDDGKLLTWDRDTGKRRDFHTGSSGGSVRCLAFDPKGELLAAALASGALVIFGVDDASERFRCNAWRKSAAVERLLMAWRPDGSMLALPGSTSVRLVARENYATTETLLEGGHRYASSLAAWSADGDLLATASLEAVALWRPPFLVKVGKSEFSRPYALLKSCRLGAAPHSLMWGGSNVVAVGTISGCWAHIAAPSVTSDETTPAASPAQENAQLETQQDAKPATASEGESLPPLEVPQDPAPGPVTMTPLVQTTFQPGASRDTELRRRFLAWNEHGTLRLILNDAIEQHDSKRRKMEGSTEKLTGRVEVEYSRLQFRTAAREIKAPEGLVMGALGPGTCALATSSNADAGRPAKVIVHVAKAAFGQKSCFEQALTQGEEIEALAVGKLFVASLTSNNNLRLDTLAGVPIDALNLSGSPVCLVAGEDMLLVILNSNSTEGSAADGNSDQSQEMLPKYDTMSSSASPQGLRLQYIIYGVSAKKQLATGHFRVTAGSSLRWCGFSAGTLPMILDSSGVLQTLTRNSDATFGDWLPVAELEGSGERLWPVHAEGRSLFCAELSKSSPEPRMGGVQKLRPIPFRKAKEPLDEAAERTTSEATRNRPIPRRPRSKEALHGATTRLKEPEVEATSASKEQPVEEASDEVTPSAPDELEKALEAFRSAAKVGDAEALQIIFTFLTHTKDSLQKARILEEALSLAVSLDQHSLAEQLVAVWQKSQASQTEVPEETAQYDKDARDEAVKVDVSSQAADSHDTPAPVASPEEDSKAAGSVTAGGLNPEVARRIEEKRAKALERKAAIAAAKAGEKRPPSESSLTEAPSALRLRAC